LAGRAGKLEAGDDHFVWRIEARGGKWMTAFVGSASVKLGNEHGCIALPVDVSVMQLSSLRQANLGSVF
jgi:hypothetical protein